MRTLYDISSRPHQKVPFTPAEPRHGPSSRGGIRPLDWMALGLSVLAVLVPSTAWVDTLRSSPAPQAWSLPLGGLLFRLGLVAIAGFVFITPRLGLWTSTPSVIRPLGPVSPARISSKVALAVILVSALLMRLHGLDRGPWLDEIITLVLYARSSFGDIVTTYDSQNQHVLYSLLAHTSFLAFGESVWALRLPSVFLGVASLAALYVFARRVTGQDEALAATAVMAFSYHHVWFSQNARGYMGLLFWTLLASWLMVRAMTEDRPRLWSYYAAVVALGIYTHLTMIFVVAGQFLIYLAMAGRLKGSRRWAALRPAVIGFGLAGLLTFQLHAVVFPQVLGPGLTEASTIPEWRSPLWTLQEMIRGFHLGFGAGLGGLVALSIIGLGFRSYLATAPVVVWLLLVPAALGGTTVVGLGHHLWPRFFFFAFGFGVVVAVRGIRIGADGLGRLVGWTAVESARLNAACMCAVVGLSAISVLPAYRPKQDYAGARDFIRTAVEPGDAVVVVGLAAFPYRNYYEPTWQTAESLSELNAVRNRTGHTWVVCTFPTHLYAVYPDVLATIERDFRLVRRFDGSIGDGVVLVYRSEADVPARAAGSAANRQSPALTMERQ